MSSQVLQQIDHLLSFFVPNYSQIELQNTIIIINGTVGVGKSSTGDALNNMIENCVFIDGDAFYQHSNLNHTNCSDWYQNWTSIICTNINLHLNKFKTTNFIISYVFENEKSLLYLINAIKNTTNCKHTSFYCFLLMADVNVIHSRIKKRAISVYDEGDIDSLKWDLNRSKELQDILLSKHHNRTHCIGQLIDTTDLISIEQVANTIKLIVSDYEYNIRNWKSILDTYSIENDQKNDGSLGITYEPMDFLNEFKDIIVSRKKSATTRWLKDEPFRVDLKANKWMIATIDSGNKPFGILYVTGIESYRLKDINDKIAKIENMETGKELIDLLKQIYPNINDNDVVQVIYFNCTHFIDSI